MSQRLLNRFEHSTYWWHSTSPGNNMKLLITTFSLIAGASALPTSLPIAPPSKHNLNDRDSSYLDNGINRTAPQKSSQEYASQHNLPHNDFDSTLKTLPFPLTLNESTFSNRIQNHKDDFLNTLLALEAAESSFKPTPSSSPSPPTTLSTRDIDPPVPANLSVTTYASHSCLGPGTTTNVSYHEYVIGPIISYYIDRDLAVDEELDLFTGACSQLMEIGEVELPDGGGTQAMPKGCYQPTGVADCFEVGRYDGGE